MEGHNYCSLDLLEWFWGVFFICTCRRFQRLASLRDILEEFVMSLWCTVPSPVRGCCKKHNRANKNCVTIQYDKDNTFERKTVAVIDKFWPVIQQPAAHLPRQLEVQANCSVAEDAKWSTTHAELYSKCQGVVCDRSLV